MKFINTKASSLLAKANSVRNSLKAKGVKNEFEYRFLTLMKIERRMNQSDENRSIFIRGVDSTNHLGSPYAKVEMRGLCPPMCGQALPCR